MTDPKRQTGRTTRMLGRAVKLAIEGKFIIVVMNSQRDVYQLSREIVQEFLRERVHHFSEANDGWGLMFRDFGGDRLHKGRIDITVPQRDFSWEEMRFKGMDHETVVLVDHHAIESKYSLMLEELGRYDVNPQSAPQPPRPPITPDPFSRVRYGDLRLT